MSLEWQDNGTAPALREALGYISRYRGETFVLKIESGVLDDPMFGSLIRDIAALHRMGIRIVVVPGSRHQIDHVLATYGVGFDMVGDVRITTEEAIPLVSLAAFSVCNRIMTMFTENGLNALIGNWVKARGLGVQDGIDFQSTGQVAGLRLDILRRLVVDEFVPILPNIGWSGTGRPYNISSTQLAQELAVQLGASKLFFVLAGKPVLADGLTLPDGLVPREGGTLSSLNLAQVEEILSANPEKLGQPHRDYFEHGLDACRHGVRRTHIIDGRLDGTLLREVFSQYGHGTMIYANEYEHIRRATAADVSEILRVMEPSVASGMLVARTAEQVLEKIGDYVVHEVDGFVQGCAALHVFADRSGEIAAVAVSQETRREGVGRKLVQYLIDRAAQQGLARVFLLTTKAADWFATLGFVQGEPAALPPERGYNQKRRSQVWIKTLRP